VSILDGWWAEGFSPEYGWAIGGEKDTSDQEALLATLEYEVVPRFYEDRGAWVEMMKASIAEIGVRFSSDRMVREYVEKLYVPAARSSAAASSGATVFT
jgi:starch phosphorylase